MQHLFDYLLPPTILFMIFVAPLWVIFHYRSRKQADTGLSEHERLQLEELLVKLDKVSDRVATLEEILVEKHGNWRETIDQGNYKS
ncbi:MAG: envelope stress response membrane protein PspB [Cellvibrionaceae bacterium]|nr:envelope stress response membrane protein PspB [Cellvibrionaceae bacterium]